MGGEHVTDGIILRAGEPVTDGLTLCIGPVTAGVIRHTGPKHICRLAKLPPKYINFLFCYRDRFVKLLTASTSFETARQQNTDNNGHQRTTKDRRQRTDVWRSADSKKGHVHTSHQKYQRQRRRKYQRCTERTPRKRRHCRQRQQENESRGRFVSSRGTCAHSAPYCVVTGTHWRCTQSSPRRDFGRPTHPGDGDLQNFKHSKSISATFERSIQMLCGFGKCTEDISCKMDVLHGNGI